MAPVDPVGSSGSDRQHGTASPVITPPPEQHPNPALVWVLGVDGSVHTKASQQPATYGAVARCGLYVVVDRYVISVPPGAIICDRCFSQEGQVIETRHT